MLVPNDLEQERTEGTPPQLVSLLFGTFFFAGLRKRVVCDGRLAVHPAALLHPFAVDLPHVGFGEDGGGGCFWFAAKV